MSSRESLPVLLVVCGLFCGLSGLSDDAAGQETAGGSVTCPATITTSETAAIPGWKAENATLAHSFERISVYNGDPGAQEYELAPDETSGQKGNITQRWDLAAYRSMNIFLRCRYSGTTVVLIRDLAAPIQSCTFRFNIDNKGKITGKSEMECR